MWKAGGRRIVPGRGDQMNRRDTILVADDVEINRAVLRSIFEEDYNVLEAENGEQALFLMRQYRDSIAIVLLDLIMPVRDGYEVMEEWQADPSLRGLPVAVITADVSPPATGTPLALSLPRYAGALPCLASEYSMRELAYRPEL